MTFELQLKLLAVRPLPASVQQNQDLTPGWFLGGCAAMREQDVLEAAIAADLPL